MHLWDVLNHRFKALANRPFESVSPKDLFVYCIKLSRNLQPMHIGYFGCLCLLVELQSAYPVYFAVNASMDRAFCCLYPVHYAVNGKIDRAICCLFPVHYAVNGKIDRAICCLYPVYYAVNGKIDRAICCLFPVHYAGNVKMDRGFCSHFPVHYAVNGKIDRAFYCLYPVYYAVNASMDRDLLLYIKVHCLYWRTMKSGRTIMQEFSAYIGQMMNGSRIAREKSCCLGFVVFFHNMS